jgi:hypothetical protein
MNEITGTLMAWGESQGSNQLTSSDFIFTRLPNNI